MQFTMLPVTAFAQNCTLLACEKTAKAALVDPGGDLETLLNEVKEQGLTLEKILLTHAHIDHAGGAGQLAREQQLPIEGPHQGDKFWIDALDQQAQMFGFPPAEIFEPARWLEQGDQVSVGEETLEVRHCPGHTPGHVIFYHPTNRVAIVGDVIFQGSIGRTDFPQGDHATLLESIRTQILSLDDEVQLITGHGPSTTVGAERHSNPFLR
jgi:glyoxylase-like metal-dependent hydrolase (beta-lactamase superfamily II)